MSLKYLGIVLMLFAMLSFVSLAAGNVALGLAAFCFLVCAFRHRELFQIPDRMYYGAMAVLSGAMFLSALASGDIAKGLLVWSDDWLWRALPFFMLTILIRDAAVVKKIFIASLIGLTIDALCVIGQWLFGELRPAGFVGHPMTFAGYACVYLPILLVFFFEKRDALRWQVGIGALWMLIAAALLMNATRGGWLAVTAVTLLLLAYYFFRYRKLAVLVLCLFTVAGVGLAHYEPFLQRFLTITDAQYQSNSERCLMWQSAFHMFQDHPVLGVGLGQYKSNYQEKYILPEAKERENGHAHNNFIQMAAENGAAGLAGFLALISGFIGVSLWRFRKEKNPYALMMAMSTLALILQGLTEYNFGNSAVMKCFWLAEGCLLVLSQTWKDPDAPEFLGDGK